jgi:hypothetical protein
LSDNQEEFDALRKAVYPFVNENGKDAIALRNFCERFMHRWRQDRGERGPTSRADHDLIDDVVRWMMNRYNRPRYQPKRSREERAATFLIAPGIFEMSGEIYGKATIRNAARLTEQSKSTVARHLQRQGIAPRRQAKIRKLSKTTQQLVAILDATFDRRAAGLIKLDWLGTALWDDNVPRSLPTTTRASRLKKLKTLLSGISAGGFGYSIVVMGDLCGIFRGRRFRSLSEAATWIEEEKRLGRYVSIQLPSPDAEPAETYFWADPFVVDVMTLIDMSVTGRFYPFEKLDALWRFEQPVIDLAPIAPWIERAYHSDADDNMGNNLAMLSSKITDPTVQTAVRRLATVFQNLKGFMGGYPIPVDAFQTVDIVLGFMDKVAVSAPESFARLAWIRDWFDTMNDEYLDVQPQLSRMLELEKAGEWQAPEAETLSRYLPDATPEAENDNES